MIKIAQNFAEVLEGATMSKFGAGVLAVLALALVAAANAEVFFQEDFTGRCVRVRVRV